VATLRDALAPGSVLAHATDASRPVVTQAAEKVYNHGVSAQARMRSGEEIVRFFGGFELVDPGLAYIPLWRPDPGADVSADPGKFWVLAGAGRKP
jgi:S-adenosyl methyltransferase